jgi:hypothetical protein
MIKYAGLALIILGILALTYQQFTYTTTKQDAKIGSLEIQHDETKSIPLSPIVGSALVVSGVAVLIVGTRRRV